jgi:hypothetical protein
MNGATCALKEFQIAVSQTRPVSPQPEFFKMNGGGGREEMQGLNKNCK